MNKFMNAYAHWLHRRTAAERDAFVSTTLVATLILGLYLATTYSSYLFFVPTGIGSAFAIITDYSERHMET
jgi:hypothetical protein